MLTVYFLPIHKTNNTEAVLGKDIIHDAILQCTEDPLIRKLIMDTTPQEHSALDALAIDVRAATIEEFGYYHQTVVITEPDPDTIRAAEILATSPDVITMPEIWELLRIIGRRLGYRLD